VEVILAVCFGVNGGGKGLFFIGKGAGVSGAAAPAPRMVDRRFGSSPARDDDGGGVEEILMS
jgi:hypothetical protein